MRHCRETVWSGDDLQTGLIVNAAEIWFRLTAAAVRSMLQAVQYYYAVYTAMIISPSLISESAGQE